MPRKRQTKTSGKIQKQKSEHAKTTQIIKEKKNTPLIKKTLIGKNKRIT